MMDRYFINASSTFNPDHKYHGTLVIAPSQLSGILTTVYPITGEIISLIVLTDSLSRGWPDHLRESNTAHT